MKTQQVDESGNKVYEACENGTFESYIGYQEKVDGGFVKDLGVAEATDGVYVKDYEWVESSEGLYYHSITARTYNTDETGPFYNSTTTKR